MPLPYYMTINTITTNTRGSRAETIGTTSHIPYSPLTAPHPPSKECQVREGKCDAFTTNSVVGCTGSEVRHAFASHLLLANPPRPSSTSPPHQAPCFPTQTPNHPQHPTPRPHPQPPSQSHLPSRPCVRLSGRDATCDPPSQVPPSAPPPPPRTAESCYNKLAAHEYCYEVGASTQGACEAYFFERQYGCDAPRTRASEAPA